MRPEQPHWRKPVGMLLLTAGLAGYALLVSAFADRIGRLPVLAQGLVYLVLGIVWVFPARPLIVWIETGRWRPPRH